MGIPMPETNQAIIHLGFEGDGVSERAADFLLRDSHLVSFVGLGYSMHPFIPNGTRMVFAPWTGGRPKKYDVLFCKRGDWYTTHMCWVAKRRKFLMVDTLGGIYGYLPNKSIRGIYIGSWSPDGIVPYDPYQYIRD
jgi:hypothetical protein